MKIPDKIKIGGYVYTVEVTDNLKNGASVIGEIDCNDLKIRLRPMNHNKMEQTFLHEVVHGILDFLGYNEQDEKHVDEFAGAFHALIVDNPDLFNSNMLATNMV